MTIDIDYSKYWELAMSYSEYRELMAEQTAEGSTSGPNQSESMVGYTALNERRMQRLDRKTKLEPGIEDQLQNLIAPQRWLVITETWCGDAAQILPILNKMSEQNDGIIMKLIWRDEFPELIDTHLSNGSRAIPKLIGLSNNFEPLGDWGARPIEAQELVMRNKKKLSELEGEERKARSTEAQIELQQWYNRDKGISTQREVMEALLGWKK